MNRFRTTFVFALVVVLGLAAVQAVGYEGTLAVDYRGEDDPTLGILHSVSALEAALDELAGG